MVIASGARRPTQGPRYAGLRMSADEYLGLPDDGYRYQVVNGVVLMSPSPTPLHGKIARLVETQIGTYADARDLGETFHEIDVRFAADLVYRPDAMFFRRERMASVPQRITTPPDFVLEVLSPESDVLDLRTKRGDYERFGVREYMVVDPETREIQFFRLRDGKYEEIAASGDWLELETIPGLKLDLVAIRRAFEAA